MNILDLPTEILYHILHEFFDDNTINGIINNTNSNNNYSIYSSIYTTPEKYNIIICVCKQFRSIINLMNINFIHNNSDNLLAPDNVGCNIYVFNQKYPSYNLVNAILSRQYDTYIIYTYNSKDMKWNIHMDHDPQSFCDGTCKSRIFIVDMYTNKVILNYTLDKVPYYTINYENIGTYITRMLTECVIGPGIKFITIKKRFCEFNNDK